MTTKIARLDLVPNHTPIIVCSRPYVKIGEGLVMSPIGRRITMDPRAVVEVEDRKQAA